MLEIREQLKFLEDNKWYSDKIKLHLDNNYLYYDTKIIKTPKISSHTLVDLLGFNSYSSPGKTLMNMFGLLAKTKIEPYQEVKGGIAEVFAKRYLQKKYKHAIDIESFTVSQFKDTGMNQFPEAAPFSGVLDLMLHFRDTTRMTVEVKSKEMKDYDLIAKMNQFPKEQVVQGANQAILAGTTRYLMLWIFLTPALSKLLKALTKMKAQTKKLVDSNGNERVVDYEDNLWIWGYDFERAVDELEITEDHFLFYSKEFEADPRMIGAYREKALKLYNDFYINRRIERKLFNRDEISELKKLYLK